MKKPVALLLSVLLLCLSAAGIAEAPIIDLAGLSFDQLVALREQLNLAIWNSREWQEVTVPAGFWTIGEDIPEGHWTITPMDNRFTHITYCEKVKESGKKYSPAGKHFTYLLISKTHAQHDDGLNAIDFDMVSGWHFINEDSVTFTPYVGKPDLGFK